MHIDENYHNLLKKILKEGYNYEDPNRKGVIRKELASYTFKHSFSDGFPAITLKKLAWKSVVTECLWFLRGNTNIKYLVDNGCNIWNKDAYSYYLKHYVKQYPNSPQNQFTIKEFVDQIKDDRLDQLKGFKLGDLGKVYGYYWRDFDGVDQIAELIHDMINKPMSSELLVVARDPSHKEDQALPCCFTEDMLVRKKDNYCKISDINVGDYVLTQDSTLQKVTDTSKVKYKGIIKEFRIFGNSRKIKCTPNHPFLIKDKGFIKASEVVKNDFVGIPINKKSEIPVFKELVKVYENHFKEKELDFKKLDYWYLMGYFLGDGWLIDSKKEILFSVADKDVEELVVKFKNVLGVAKIQNNRSKCTILSGKNQILFNVLSKFGKYSHGKTIPDFILDAPVEYIKEFLKGYQKADGCVTKDGISFTTVSDNIAYSLQLLYAKIGVKASIYYQNRPKTTVIEGRKVNQKNTYSVNIYKSKNKSSNYILDDHYLWMKVVNIEDVEIDDYVYNLTVEHNHTYNVFNIINHNCHYGFQIVMKPLSLTQRYKMLKESLLFEQFLKEQHVRIANKTSENFKSEFLDQYFPKYGFELHWKQRSVDTFLGLPFNIASYALLALILEKITGHKALGIQGDLKKVHLYDNSFEAAKELITRKCSEEKVRMHFAGEEVDQLIDKVVSGERTLDQWLSKVTPRNFKLIDYNPQPAIRVAMLARTV